MQRQWNIRELRERLILSQEEFASLIGVSRQTVYLWEKGKSKITEQNMKKILKLLEK